MTPKIWTVERWTQTRCNYKQALLNFKVIKPSNEAVNPTERKKKSEKDGGKRHEPTSARAPCVCETDSGERVAKGMQKFPD